jgi:aspartyl-tRNA synthetase
MADRMRTRHAIVQCLRRRLEDEHQFIEVETPILTRSTPEGARDYVVWHPLLAHSLPQEHAACNAHLSSCFGQQR